MLDGVVAVATRARADDGKREGSRTAAPGRERSIALHNGHVRFPPESEHSAVWPVMTALDPRRSVAVRHGSPSDKLISRGVVHTLAIPFLAQRSK